MNNIKVYKHFGKYFNWYIFIPIVFILVNIFLFKLLNEYKESEESKYNNNIYNSLVEDFYNYDNNFIEFNEEGVSILKVEKLYYGIKTEEIITKYSIPFFDKNFDQCLGYFIIKKLDNNKLDIDASHICDMID